ncbi:MAG: CBS domain-containing protein [Desulfobacteraceae bacterium]|nr:CBS domain-containing protein [Desulfobacteraceae bacterium]
MKTAADILREKRTSRLVEIPHDATIMEAAARMAGERVGSILVRKNDQIVGIWTERDFLHNMLEPGFDPHRAAVGDYMQTALVAVSADTPIYRLEEMFLGLFIRHLLVKANEAYLGLLSIGDVLRSSLLEKDREIRELNRIASWEYYENWAWHHKYEPKTGRGHKDGEDE